MYCSKCGRKHNTNKCFCLGSDTLSKQSVLFIYSLVIMIPSTLMIVDAMKNRLTNIDYIMLGTLALVILLSVILAMDLLLKKPFLALFFGCHQQTHKSFKIGSKYFVLCSRCTGIFIGVFISFSISLFFQNWLLLLLGLPLVLDGLFQKYTNYESTNLKRLFTGVLFGLSLSYVFSIYNYLIIYVFNWLLTLMNINLLN